MTDAHTWLEEVLKGIVPVVIGSLITLLGVWLQGRSESKRLKIQLRHDSEQREKERQMDLRRDVFLGAAEALGKQAEYINLFGKVDFDFWKEQEILKGNVGAGYKVHLIAGIETIEAYARANQCWANAVLELSKKRLEVEEVKAELSSQESLIAMLSNRRDEALASMKSLVNSGVQYGAAYQFHQKRFDDCQEEISDEMGKKAKLLSMQVKLLLEISAVCMTAQMEFSKRLQTVSLAARRDVNLALDENKYQELQALITREVQEAGRVYIEDMKVWINKQEEKLLE